MTEMYAILFDKTLVTSTTRNSLFSIKLIEIYRVGCGRKFGMVSCMESIGQDNDFELIPMVEMETRNPVESYLEFPQFVIVVELWWPEVARR